MKVDSAAQEGEEEGVAGIWILDAEGWVLHQLLNIFEVPRHIGTSLSASRMLTQFCSVLTLFTV